MNSSAGLNHLFSAMWKDYCKMNPQAQAVFDSLTKAGEKVVNDHIAFRTFGHPKFTIPVLETHFLKYGYRQAGEYKFAEKKLNAKHFEHDDPQFPKVFISELDLSLCSPFVNDIVNKIAEQMEPQYFQKENSLFGGRPWPASHSVFKKLAAESEYAAWVYAHGYRPNHFTVFINHLQKLNQIADLNQFLRKEGFPLNEFGGAIKGSPQDYLEQSSTMANEVPVHFVDGTFLIPGCYYEFAKRYPLSNGKLFQGFVAKSADKIFESTNNQAQ